MSKIVFLTSTNLATNPRLVKEINLAIEEGLDISILSFYLGNWSDPKSEQLFNSINSTSELKNHVIKYYSSKNMYWLFWAVAEKLAILINPYFKNSIFLSALANSRRSLLLYFKLKRLARNADIIVSHNLPTLYPASQISKKYGIPFTFDVEDYHPGEISNDLQEKNRTEFLMTRLLTNATAITAASPLITSYGERLLQNKVKIKTVLNAFPETEFTNHKINSDKTNIKCVWFSQNINYGRGLEELFVALSMYQGHNPEMHLEVTLIGDINEEFKRSVIDDFLKRCDDQIISLKVVKPMSQRRLHRILYQFDVGLCLELTETNFNRNICLTNKIFAYAQSGLFILATDTLAQGDFMSNRAGLGCLVEQSSDGILKGLKHIAQNIHDIKEDKDLRFYKAKKLSWDKEKIKVATIWQNILN